MSFQFQNIKYGWVALAGIVLTGTTIFIVGNARWRVKQIDVIPPVIATWERCEATRTGTNSWRVPPPTFIRSWVTTNNVGQYITQTVTNAIGWRIDHDMLEDCILLIPQLITNYCDNNGNAYTVTGVYADVGIDDLDISWRVTTNVLVQMCKVLWKLSNTVCTVTWQNRTMWGEASHTNPNETIGLARSRALADFVLDTVGTSANFLVQRNAQEYVYTNYNYLGTGITTYGCALINTISDATITNLSTNVAHRSVVWGIPKRVGGAPYYLEFYDQGMGYTESNYTLLASSALSYNSSITHANVCGGVTNAPAPGIVTPTDESLQYFYGFQVQSSTLTTLVNWDFQYANTKFW